MSLTATNNWMRYHSKIGSRHGTTVATTFSVLCLALDCYGRLDDVRSNALSETLCRVSARKRDKATGNRTGQDVGNPHPRTNSVHLRCVLRIFCLGA